MNLTDNPRASSGHRPRPRSIRPEPDDMRRQLGLFDATMINAGSMIGSGIFLVPTTIAVLAGASAPALLIWM